MYLFKVWFSLDISPRMRLQDNMVSPYPEGIYFCFIDYTKVFDCVDDNKLWKILQQTGILDHLTCPRQNLHTGQVAKVTMGHGTMGWFQIGNKDIKPGNKGNQP